MTKTSRCSASKTRPDRCPFCTAAVVALIAIVFPTDAQSACPPAAVAMARVVAVDERGELVLDDKRIVALASIDMPADPDKSRAVHTALADWLVGHSVGLHPTMATEDRWGRTIADVVAPADFSPGDDSTMVSAAAVLVEAGLARVRAHAASDACVSEMLASEVDARRNRLGLWSDPYYAVLDAANLTALAAHDGRFTIVEGQVTHVGIGRSRTYIDFGKGRDAFTVLASKRVTKAFAQAGLPLESLSGIRVRVRGVLDTHDGPRIDMTGPSDAERL